MIGWLLVHAYLCLNVRRILAGVPPYVTCPQHLRLRVANRLWKKYRFHVKGWELLS